MKLELYQRVALRIDVPEHGLRAGDVATLVDLVPHPAAAATADPEHSRYPRGCVLEVFNALGDSIAVITVPETSIQHVHANEVLAVRPLAKVA